VSVIATGVSFLEELIILIVVSDESNSPSLTLTTTLSSRSESLFHLYVHEPSEFKVNTQLVAQVTNVYVRVLHSLSVASRTPEVSLSSSTLILVVVTTGASFIDQIVIDIVLSDEFQTPSFTLTLTKTVQVKSFSGE
jgi:hypothetical protein